MPNLRIRFVATRGLGAGVIRAAQLGFPWNHAEVETFDEAGGRVYLGAHLAGGVTLREPGYDAGRDATEIFATLDVSEASASAFHAYLRAQIGKPYDLRAILDFALAVAIHPPRLAPEGAWLDPERWFCSELVAAALLHAGILSRVLAASARRVTPQSLAFALSTIAAFDAPAPVLCRSDKTP